MDIKDAMAEVNEEALFADGFDEAVLGFVNRWNQDPVVVYDTERIIKILMERDGMPYEDAVEFFEFNTAGAYVGVNTPLFLRKLEV